MITNVSLWRGWLNFSHNERNFLFLINGYAAGYSSIAYYNVLEPIMKKFWGQFEIGELTIEESKTGRLLPCGIFARWSKN